MGVPAFFKWLISKCPQILQDAIENDELSDIEQFDSNNMDIENYNQEDKNPSIDNLYLDMNGIIHPCTHPETKGIPVPLTEEDMFNNIFAYTDRIMKIVRPKQLLFIAIDGVAPRAKMNQQRGRRFKAAQDAKKSKELKESLKEKFQQEGKNCQEIEEFVNNTFDHNVITPGTPFMERLKKALNLYIKVRMNNDPLFQQIKPGEGEHKILEYIRLQRTYENYNPNTSHCIYGADADLIMLGLSTHEAHFYILRECLQQPMEKKCRMCGQSGHFEYECTGQSKNQQEDFLLQAKKEIIVNFQFIKLYVFRDYLNLKFNDIKISFQFDLERIIDDFVFMCFFVGNDFLPHLPTLSIRQGGIDCILFLYEKYLGAMGGYLTENGILNLMRVDILIQQIAALEQQILKNISENQQYLKNLRKANQDKQSLSLQHTNSDSQISYSSSHSSLSNEGQKKQFQIQNQNSWNVEDKKQQLNQQNRKMADILKKKLFSDKNKDDELQESKITKKVKQLDQQQIVQNKMLQSPHSPHKESSDIKIKHKKQDKLNEKLSVSQYNEKLKQQNVIENAKYIQSVNENQKITNIEEFHKHLLEINEQNNAKIQNALEKANDESDLRLNFEDGYKEIYYLKKFQITPKEFIEFKQQIQKSYVEGLCWVLQYYYNGCISWSWYYPYHYAPFASDLDGMDNQLINFEKGTPFKPIDQLMAVLSPLSAKGSIPDVLVQLMIDINSPIIDFYPTQFKIDLEGKSVAWMGEVILPFIDEHRLLKEIRAREFLLNEIEIKRNQIKSASIYFHKNHEIYKAFEQLNALKLIISQQQNYQQQQVIELTQKDFKIQGTLQINKPYNQIISKKQLIPNEKFLLDKILENQIAKFSFNNPAYQKHQCFLLKDAQPIKSSLNYQQLIQAEEMYKPGVRMVNLIKRVLGLFQQPNIGNYNTRYAPNAFSYNQSTNKQSFPSIGFRNKYEGHEQANDQNRKIYRDPMVYKTREVLEKQKQMKNYQSLKEERDKRNKFQHNNYFEPLFNEQLQNKKNIKGDKNFPQKNEMNYESNKRIKKQESNEQQYSNDSIKFSSDSSQSNN